MLWYHAIIIVAHLYTIRQVLLGQNVLMGSH